jgi:hypothetical protein
MITTWPELVVPTAYVDDAPLITIFWSVAFGWGMLLGGIGTAVASMGGTAPHAEWIPASLVAKKPPVPVPRTPPVPVPRTPPAPAVLLPPLPTAPPALDLPPAAPAVPPLRWPPTLVAPPDIDASAPGSTREIPLLWFEHAVATATNIATDTDTHSRLLIIPV